MVSYAHWQEAKVLPRIRLQPSHQATGRARPYSDGRTPVVPSQLVIARHVDVTRPTVTEPVQPYPNYYLFSLDESGEEINDWCEQAPSDLLALAEATFGIQPGEWEFVSEDVT